MSYAVSAKFAGGQLRAGLENPLPVPLGVPIFEYMDCIHGLLVLPKLTKSRAQGGPMFDVFPQSPIDVVAPDGTVRCHTKALMDGKTATIPDTSIMIEAGDEIRRRIPNGTEEVFDVIDPVYHEGMAGIPAHFQATIRRKGFFPEKSGGNYNINVRGPNARVNINSQDHSQNAVGSHAVFGELKTAIENSEIAEPEKAELRKLAQQMERDAGNQKEYLSAYQAFIAVAANHMTIVAPFLPALSKVLS